MKILSKNSAFVNSKSKKPNKVRRSESSLLKNPTNIPVFEVAFKLDGYPGINVLRLYPTVAPTVGAYVVAYGLEGAPPELVNRLAQEAYSFLRAEATK